MRERERAREREIPTQVAGQSHRPTVGPSSVRPTVRQSVLPSGAPRHAGRPHVVTRGAADRDVKYSGFDIASAPYVGGSVGRSPGRQFGWSAGRSVGRTAPGPRSNCAPPVYGPRDTAPVKTKRRRSTDRRAEADRPTDRPAGRTAAGRPVGRRAQSRRRRLRLMEILGRRRRRNIEGCGAADNYCKFCINTQSSSPWRGFLFGQIDVQTARGSNDVCTHIYRRAGR